jgi:predicted unusual protein kinase regulating ubiquinone biosynthesis (AarF/ABC1/UbiB family)
MGFEEVKELPQAERDRFGEIVFRFFSGSLYRQALFSGDPHPGNFMLLADGRVAFLDFGMARRVDWAYVDAERGAVRAGFDGDAETLHARLSALGYFPADDPVITPERLLAHFKAISDWLYRDREVALDPAYVGRHMVDMGDPRSQFWDLMRRQTVPPKAMLARRMEALVLGVLGQLRASANWHAISREWLFDDPPSTPLGEAEAEFFAARSAPRAA